MTMVKMVTMTVTMVTMMIMTNAMVETSGVPYYPSTEWTNQLTQHLLTNHHHHCDALCVTISNIIVMS